MEMNMESDPPFWGTKRFGFLLLTVILSLVALAVLIFEIGPRMREKTLHEVAGAGHPVFAPPKPTDGPKDVRFDGILDKAKDNTPVAGAEFEKEEDWDEARRCLVRHMKTVTAEEAAKGSFLVNYPQFSKYASDLRGVGVRLTGMLIEGTRMVKLPKDAIEKTGVEWVHRAYVMELSGDGAYVVDLMEPWESKEFRPLVTTDAIFLKMGTYEGEKKTKQVPYLVGRKLTQFKLPADEGMLSVTALVGAVGLTSVVIVGFLTFGIWRGSQPKHPAPVLTRK